MKIFWIQDVNYGDLDYKEDILSVLGQFILFHVDVIQEPFLFLVTRSSSSPPSCFSVVN